MRAGLFVDGKAAVLSLARRKNRERRTQVVRECWCQRSRSTCPMHALGAWLRQQPSGSAPWVAWSAESARRQLRAALRGAGIGNAEAYGTHAFRRGHAQDILEGGGRLEEILRAGDWRMPAWMRYLNSERLEQLAVAEAHLAESSSDDDGASLGASPGRPSTTTAHTPRVGPPRVHLCHGSARVRRSIASQAARARVFLRRCALCSASVGYAVARAEHRPQPLGPRHWVRCPCASAGALPRCPTLLARRAVARRGGAPCRGHTQRHGCFAPKRAGRASAQAQETYGGVLTCQCES